MRLEFQLKRIEYKEFKKNVPYFVWPINPGNYYWFYQGIWFLPRWREIWRSLLFLILIFLAFDSPHYWPVWALLGLTFFGWVIYDFYIIPPHFRASQILSFRLRDIFYQSEGKEEEISWDSVERLLETENLLILVLEFKKALAIPKRIFIHPNHLEEFRKLCRENIPPQN